MADCPKCSQILVKSNTCGLCGWKRGDPTVGKRPSAESLHAEGAALIRQYNPHATATDAAAMIALWEPQGRWESPQSHGSTQGDTIWHWPYRDRILYLTRKFLSADGELQRIILRAAEDNIHWRGDDLRQFHAVIQAAEEYRAAGGHPAVTAKSYLGMLRDVALQATRGATAQLSGV